MCGLCVVVLGYVWIRVIVCGYVFLCVFMSGGREKRQKIMEGK